MSPEDEKPSSSPAEIPLMETLCSSGAPGSLLPPSAFPRTESGRALSYRRVGSPGGDRVGGPSRLTQGTGQLGCRSFERTRSALMELLAHHSHQQSALPSRAEREEGSFLPRVSRNVINSDSKRCFSSFPQTPGKKKQEVDACCSSSVPA